MLVTRIAAIAGSVLIVGASLAGCSSSSSSSATSSPSVSPTATAAEGYTAAIESTFVENCSKASQSNGISVEDSNNICGCTYRGIAAKVPYADFIAADADVAKGGQLPQAIVDIRDECNKDPKAY